MYSACQSIYSLFYEIGDSRELCGLCRGTAVDVLPLNKAVNPGFADRDQFVKETCCLACHWAMSNANIDLQEFMRKDKPQRCRNYSHFRKGADYQPLSKAQKQEMLDLLLAPPFPGVAVIANSGQKHLLPFAPLNPFPIRGYGQVMFENDCFELHLDFFNELVCHCQALYDEGWNKKQIETGQYVYIRGMDIRDWRRHEKSIGPHRGTKTFQLALYLITRGKETDA